MYSLLDWIGDVGGLKDGLCLIGSFMIQFYTLVVGDPLNKYLLKSLFKVERIPRKSQDSNFGYCAGSKRRLSLRCNKFGAKGSLQNFTLDVMSLTKIMPK